MNKILIIEDHVDINHLLAEALRDAGYEGTSVYNGADGIDELKKQDYSLVLLDLMLPYRSGEEVLRELRQFSDIPVIVISAKEQVGIKINLLKMGADDYVTKPLDLTEVVARVEANLRRAHRQQQEAIIYRHKDLTMEDSAKRVCIGDVEVDLTAKEYQILEQLMQHPGKVYTKSNLYETIWQDDYETDENAVKTHISNLRNKLKKVNPNEEYIETVWGLGYRLHRG